MKLNRLIIHEIKKEEKQTDVVELLKSEEMILIGNSEIDFLIS